MERRKVSRRDFNKTAAMAAASLALSAGPAVRNVLGANDRVGIGLIGAGGMGQFDCAISCERAKLTAWRLPIPMSPI